VPIIDGVYQFTEDKPISVDGDGLKWLGYENVGENYEPGYVYNKENDSIGNCKYFADYMGRDKIILDLGAGLGGSSISFALSGLCAIAADISQVMLETAIERAKKHNAPSDKIIFARMNGYKLELADNSVDAVLSIDMLHQVDLPELVIEEIKRVLKPDGYFLQYGGGSGKGGEYTEEQAAANARYEDARKDIQSFYDNIINEDDYRIFTSWEEADNCIEKNFVEFKTISDTGVYSGNNTFMEWRLKVGLHKIKTRASGVKQLIPDEIHNEAWVKTDEYAKSKYGDDYGEMTRYFVSGSGRFGGMKLYKLRDKR
jgi:ubiquinone/menaquinone biosynthesis C-methylase UbiE